MALITEMYSKKQWEKLGRSEVARGREVWEGTNTNSLAISTNEILKVSSSWEEGS